MASVKDRTFALVAQFLLQNNLSATYEALLDEAHFNANFDISNDLPLLKIVEDYQVNNSLAKTLASASFSESDLPFVASENYANTLKTTLYGIHFSNILCAVPYPPTDSSQSESTLITSSADKSVRLSHSQSGKLLSIITERPAAILDIDVHPLHSNILLISSMDGSHALIDISTGETVQEFIDHGKFVVRARFSPAEGDWFATASYDGNVNIYLRNEQSLEISYSLASVQKFNGPVESICFLPPDEIKGKNTCIIVGVRNDNYLHYIELPGESATFAFKITKYNMNATNDDWVSFNPMCLSVSPDNQYILCYTDSNAGRMILFKTHSSVQARNFWGVSIDGFSQPRCCWDGSGNYVYATSDDKSIWVFEVKSGKCVDKLKGHERVVRDLRYDGENGQLVSCSYDKSVRLWKRQ